MTRILLLLLIATIAFAQEVPRWVLTGILGVETSSRYDEVGRIVYVNRKNGGDGEQGPFQMTRGAFKMVARHGETFDRLRTDTAYAEELAVRYLLYLRENTHSWDHAVRAYNVGLGGVKRGRGSAYLASVRSWNRNQVQ